jgi:hypothetical protein
MGAILPDGSNASQTRFADPEQAHSRTGALLGSDSKTGGAASYEAPRLPS